MAKIKTFKDACKALKIEPIIPSFEDVPEHIRPVLSAQFQLMLIIEAVNEGWVPDWNNWNEYKYYPYFDMEGDFSLSNVTCGYGYSDVSSRLCFKSRDLARSTAETFIELYKQLYTK